MSHLVQDFPKYSKSVSALELDTEFEQEILRNQRFAVQGGSNAVWVNGKALEMNQIDPFQ